MDTRRNNSKKRELLLTTLQARTDHPTAEMLYTALKAEHPQLSLGTVYRNLSVLTEQGLAVPVATVDGQLRYDGRTEAHAHFICRRCRCVADLELPDTVTPMYAWIAAQGGFLPEAHALNVRGLCGACKDQ